jgi:ABC-type uncharacterized transport system ATPase subunit
VLYGEVEQIQRDFGGHAVLVEGEGELPQLPGVLEVRHETNGAGNGAANHALHLSLESGTTPQDVFRALAGQTAYQVERFEIAEPSLEEIFVSVVQQEAPRPEEAPRPKEAPDV